MLQYSVTLGLMMQCTKKGTCDGTRSKVMWWYLLAWGCWNPQHWQWWGPGQALCRKIISHWEMGWCQKNETVFLFFFFNYFHFFYITILLKFLRWTAELSQSCFCSWSCCCVSVDLCEEAGRLECPMSSFWGCSPCIIFIKCITFAQQHPFNFLGVIVIVSIITS